jgi:hypothetical protein
MPTAVWKQAPLKKTRKKRAGKAIYGPQAAALKTIWEYFGFMCGQLLAPFIRANMAYLKQEEAFHITPTVKEKLLAISPAVINRKLEKEAAPGYFRHETGKMAETHYPKPNAIQFTRSRPYHKNDNCLRTRTCFRSRSTGRSTRL